MKRCTLQLPIATRNAYRNAHMAANEGVFHICDKCTVTIPKAIVVRYAARMLVTAPFRRGASRCVAEMGDFMTLTQDARTKVQEGRGYSKT